MPFSSSGAHLQLFAFLFFFPSSILPFQLPRLELLQLFVVFLEVPLCIFCVSTRMSIAFVNLSSSKKSKKPRLCKCHI
ncbi:hypothetical protein HanRHA438_Chr04g0178051 [Helianthus annuus]|nr:hypothetical protein HanRHA438_Chr04g0178051 [Helianthus annuus]